MRTLVLRTIAFYQHWLSPDRGYFSARRKYCVFEPSCSEYAKQAILNRGICYGLILALSRIVRCHPFQKKLFDPFIPRDKKLSQSEKHM